MLPGRPETDIWGGGSQTGDVNLFLSLNLDLVILFCRACCEEGLNFHLQFCLRGGWLNYHGLELRVELLFRITTQIFPTFWPVLNCHTLRIYNFFQCLRRNQNENKMFSQNCLNENVGCRHHCRDMIFPYLQNDY